MTIRHLQIFREVCQKQSITAAADRLNMTQPAVSMAIKELECFYQTKLFDRLNRRIYLTESGLRLKQYTDQILEQFDEASAVLLNEPRCGGLRLGVNVSVAETILPDLLSRLKKVAPDADVRITVENTRATEEKLQNNDIDIALLDGFSPRGGRKTKRILEEKMEVVCSPSLFDGALTVSQLAERPLLLREKGSGSRLCVDALFLRHGHTVSPTVESQSTLSLIELAKSGAGYTLIPQSIARKVCDMRTLCPVPITNDVFNRYYYAVYLAKKHITPTMSALLALCEREQQESGKGAL